MGVKTVDISQFLHGSKEEKSTFAKQLVAYFREDGVVRLIGHGISPLTISNIFDWIRKYFELPTDLRRKHVNPESATQIQNPSRGYKGLSGEKVWKLFPATAGISDAKELRESATIELNLEYFDVGPPTDGDFPTPWPDEKDLPGFQQYMESRYDTFQKLALQLMRAIEMGLQIPEGTLTERCAPDASEIRLNHYPALTSLELNTRNTRRIWPHTDIGLFSFVFQGSDRGLQVEDRKSPGRFMPVLQDGADEMFVNVADTLARWTNGHLPACVHQVSTLEVEKAARMPSRRSIVFFFKASGDQSAGPLPQFVTSSHPARYDEITVSGYYQRQNRILYS